MSKLFNDVDLSSDAVSKSTFSFRQRKWTEKDWDDCLNDENEQAKKEEYDILKSVEIKDNCDSLFDFLKGDN